MRRSFRSTLGALLLSAASIAACFAVGVAYANSFVLAYTDGQVAAS